MNEAFGRLLLGTMNEAFGRLLLDQIVNLRDLTAEKDAILVIAKFS
jgi:hypothetical protein